MFLRPSSSLLALCLNLSGCFVSIAAAATRATPCSSTASVSLSASSAPQSSSGYASSPSATASSTRRVPSGSAPSGIAPSGSAPSSGQVSSRSPSSSRIRPSGSASSSRIAQSSGLASNGCPSYDPTTQTYISTVVETSTSFFPLSSYTFVLGSTVTVSVATNAIATTATFLSTTTVTVTSTRFAYEVLPASTTVTVATVPGFTPVSCMPEYLNPTVTSTTTSTSSTTTFSYLLTQSIDVTTTAYDFTSLATTTFTVSQPLELTSYTTSTSTITRSEATRTVYEACATNNLVSEGPFGSKLQIPQYRDGITLGATRLAVDAADCCAQCQADPTCVVSTALYHEDNTFECGLFVRLPSNISPCDPTYQAVDIPYSPTRDSGFNQTISNSACGQYVFTRRLFGQTS